MTGHLEDNQPDMTYSDNSISSNPEPHYSEMHHRPHRTLELPSPPPVGIYSKPLFL